MDWRLCERNFIKIAERDEKRVKSIIEKARVRLDRAIESEEKEPMISLIFEDYYEVLKELLVAYLLKNGLSSKNHQCLISYFFRNHPDKEKEANLIQLMSYFRNRLNYYGEGIPSRFYFRNKKEFKRIIDLLLELLKNNSRKLKKKERGRGNEKNRNRN